MPRRQDPVRGTVRADHRSDARPSAKKRRGIGGGLHQTRVLGQARIVIASKAQHAWPVHGHARAAVGYHHAALAARVARLVGAEPEEVAIANSMTVNLHQLLSTLYRPKAQRRKVLIDASSFPTDRYALRSHLRLRGLDPGENLAILRPGVGISYGYGKRMKRLNRLKNDELEQQVDIISSGDKKAIFKHFNNLRHWQVRISDQEAWNFGIMELMVMVVIGISLLVTNSVSGPTILAGNLIGIYTYILKFVSGLDTIPYTVQRLSSLNDITRRIELQAEDFPSEGTEMIQRDKIVRLSKMKKTIR